MASKKHNKIIIVIASVLFLLIVITAGFFIWAENYYHADDVAITTMQGNSDIRVAGNFTILSPDVPADTGIIFYPGAKVEAIAYLPLLQKLADKGYACILVKMPLNMAIFDANAADDAFAELPDVKHWYIAGHSMGGAMASKYASENPDRVDGLILMGAYIYGNYPPQNALTVYGTFNSDLEKNIYYTENIVIIDGGNHAQFGNYGKQKGDPDATISADEQQEITVNAIVDFINKKQAK